MSSEACPLLAPAPSPWVRRFGELLPAGASVLDLACGGGRHLRWLAARGCRVTGVDRDAAAVQPLRGLGEIIVADLENAAWPLAGRSFDGIVVTHYLWRPLFPQLLQALAPGGLLIYETFAAGNGRFGKPSNPDFLLRPGELLQACAGLRTLAFEDGVLDAPLRCVQRIAATRESADAPAEPARHRLTGPAG